MIVDAAWYEGRERQVMHRPIRRIAAERGSRGFAWIGLHDPTDEELDEIRDAFDLPELAVADARNNYDRPKVERHGDCLLTVVPTARYVDEREAIEFGEIFFYSGQDYLITVRHGQSSPLRGVRRDVDAHPGRFEDGPAVLLQAALLHVVQSYEPVIEGLTHDVREVERQVFSENATQPTKRIYLLIREVLDFLVALEPLSSAVKQLTSPECMPWLDPSIVPLYRDVDDVLSTVVERGRIAHEQLQSVLAASRAEAERRQNEDTRKISAWAAIGILPTIVAGFFGMNLGGIPLAEHPFGFAVVCAITILGCVLLYRLFKRSGWL
jgi:magnesium transporter